MNLRKQVEPLLSAALQASSEQRRAQRATSRLAWVLRWLRRASEKPSRAKQELRHLNVQGRGGQGKPDRLRRRLGGDLREDLVHDALEAHRALGEVALRCRLLVAGAEVFVGDV